MRSRSRSIARACARAAARLLPPPPPQSSVARRPGFASSLVGGLPRGFASSRARAALSHDCRDKIHMRDMTFHGYHGVLAEEKSLGQKFVLDVTMSACHRAAGASDDIADTVDYARAFDLVRAEVEGRDNSRNLIERVGERVARALLREFPAVRDVTVGVRKPHVAVVGVLGSLGVEVFRERGDEETW